MAFPTADAQTLSICMYAAEVAGRLDGLASAETLIPEADRRQVLKETGDTILAAVQALLAGFIQRITLEFLTQRVVLGRGRALDRAFDRFVAVTAESVRTGPAGGSRDHAEFREVFKTGSTEPYQQPTIRDDAALCEDLEERLGKVVEFAQKSSLLTALGLLKALIEPSAKAVKNGEEGVAKAFASEVGLRQGVVDALWIGKRAVEQRFKNDKALVRFIFFDFRQGSTSGSDAPSGEAPPAGGAAAPPAAPAAGSPT